jgi:glycosyltransferase involved in cell wall biosynthesis
MFNIERDYLNLGFNTKNSKSNIIACIPAFNEERRIGEIVLKSLQYVDKVIVCDDGSSDSTSKIAEKYGAIIIKHKKNIGYGSAIKSLINVALQLEADVIVTLDADGQHEPDEIPRLIKKLFNDNADIVIGSRFNNNNDYGVPRYRKIGIAFITRLVNLILTSQLKITDAQSGFRAYNKRVLKSIELNENGMGVSTEILLKANKIDMKIVEVPIHVTYDQYSSTHNPITHGVNVVLSILKLFIRARAQEG